MPHPPILVEIRETENITTSSCWATDPSWPAGGAHNVYPALRKIVFRDEPESTSNPVRSDGTRAPAPYYIRRMYFSQGTAKAWTTAADPGYWGWANGPTASESTPFDQLNGPPYLVQKSLHSANNRATVDSRARTKFLNKLADASGKDAWELGIVAGEFRETCGMAADLASSLVSSARSIASMTKRPPRLISDTLRVYGESGPKAALRQVAGLDTHLLETIVQAWLVKQFGIDPLVNDLYTASVQLSASFADPVKGAEQFTSIIRGGASDVFTRTMQVGYSWHDGKEGFDCFVDLREEIKVAFSAKYQIPVKASGWQKSGLYNPLHLAGQLTRFSWMADYVTNLSQWLRASMAGEDCRFVEGTRSVLARTTVERGYSKPKPGMRIIRDPMKSRFELTSDTFERDLLPAVGVMPSLLPSVKNRLNATKLANSIAALTTLVGARSRLGPPVISY